MNCYYCGSTLPEGSPVCKACGISQQAQPVEVRTSPVLARGFLPNANNQAPTEVSQNTPVTPTAAGSPSVAPSTMWASNTGLIVAGIGGIIALLTFFLLPFISGILLQLTGMQLASLGGQSAPGGQASGLAILWIDPIAAGIIIIAAAWPILQSNIPDMTTSRSAAYVLVILSFVILIVMFGVYFYYSQPITPGGPVFASAFSSGFWGYIVAMLVVLVGGSMQVARANKSLNPMHP
jgi:hypothetical protein